MSAHPEGGRAARPPLSLRSETPGAIATAARWLVRLGRQPDRVRLLFGILLAALGLLLATFGGLADATLHRGVESGSDEPVVLHVSGRGLATNADLTRFAPEQLPEVAAALQASGIRYVRQTFAWSDIEPRAGERVWDRYDAIVDQLTQRGIRVVAVLHRAPGWARPPEQVDFFDAPPSDPAAFAQFAEAVAARYGDQVEYYQLWDLPNRPDHWGGMAATPADYVSTILSLGFNAIRTANPTATIIQAEPDPAPAGGAAGADLAWVQGIYAAGGQPFFHVVAIRLDGGAHSPFDRGIAPDLINLSRATLFRELMIAAGDGARPIWATDFGWRAGSGPNAVSEVEQAEYAVAGIERARAEWPWLGPLFFAGLTPGPSLGGEVAAGEALLRADGSSTLLLGRLRSSLLEGAQASASTGFLPADSAQFVYEGNWSQQHLGPETFRTSNETGARFTVQFVGTGAIARVRLSPDAGNVVATLDGTPLPVDLRAGQASNEDVEIARGLPEGLHTLTMELASPGQLTIGGLLIERSLPLHWTVLLLFIGGLLLLVLGLRQLVFTLAERSGRLQRRTGIDLWPQLPHVGDWRPSRRA